MHNIDYSIQLLLQVVCSLKEILACPAYILTFAPLVLDMLATVCKFNVLSSFIPLLLFIYLQDI